MPPASLVTPVSTTADFFSEQPGVVAKPFLKWAGGKTQLLPQLVELLPSELSSGEITTYAEPFLGGGALFFYFAANSRIKNFHLWDANRELVLLYRTVQAEVEQLILVLSTMESEYQSMLPARQQEFFYEVRSKFNDDAKNIDFLRIRENWVVRSAQLIFLNRTCFNGLFRVNSRGAFNVPFGRYKYPSICDSNNLKQVSKVLQRANIALGDFEQSEVVAGPKTFFYFDPPYRPISKTSSFNSYAANAFGDAEQLRLTRYFRALDARGAKLMLSNSDPKNIDASDEFFENAYSGFRINRVMASRMINATASGRGKITELVITNY